MRSAPAGPPGARRAFRLPWPTRRQLADEIDDELRFHLEETAAALRADGWSESDAHAEAVRRFGDLEFTRQYCRAEDLRRERGTRRMTLFDELRQDLRYAVRSLRAAPAFTAVALLTLAIGIGANTAVFTVVRAVLLEPLPFAQAERIVRVWHGNRSANAEPGPVSEPDMLDWRARSRSAERIAGYFSSDGNMGMDLHGEGAPEVLKATLVTDGFFEVLGAGARVGRTFGDEEHVPGRARFVVIGHGLWERRFGGDPAVIGRTISLGRQPYVIIGVMPRGFTYPSGVANDVWMPLANFGPDDIGRARRSGFLSVVARLRPGATPESFQRELAGITTELAREHPDNAGWTDVDVRPIRESIVGDVQRPLLVLVAAVAMVLLIACVNIASLLLARGSARERELAVRAALGAGRGRIARQLLTESVTLALAGGAIGVALAVAAVRAFAASGLDLPRAADVRVDGWVLAFAVGVSVLGGLLFGVVPALRASGVSLEGSLRAGARGSVGGAGNRLRSALVVAEVALAVVLIVGAGLATKSFARLTAVSPGFDPSNALVVTISPPEGKYDELDARFAYYQGVLERVRALPGVQAAGSVRDLPFNGNGERRTILIPGETPPPAGQEPTANVHHISTDFFRAMGISLLAGRDFTTSDRAGTPPVLVVNEEFARRFFGGANPVGRSISWGGPATFQVVGMVRDVRQRGLAEPPEPLMYIHILQNPRSRMNVVIRTAGDPTRLIGPVQQAIWAFDRDQTFREVTTLQAVLGGATSRPRVLASLLGLFGIIGLVLGALGLYGVLAYAVTQRRQEIGVRVALGASPAGVLRMVVGRGLVLAAAGIVAGVVMATFAVSAMRTVLFGIEPSDPATFVQVVVVLLGVAVIASWIPARRALRIDPVVALRYD